MQFVRKILGNPRYYAWLATTKALPNILPFNYALTARDFKAFHRRWPRHPSHPRATFNDYIYHRMIRNGWNAREYRLIDKEFAKEEAKSLCPEICVTETVEVLVLPAISQTAFLNEISKFRGKPFVAKTTYGSGDVLFLRHNPSDQCLIKFYRMKNWHHFHAMRETQYAPLKKKVIVEAELPEGDTTDYKFFSARGKVLACQINLDRFGDHRKLVVSVPDFKALNAEFILPRPNNHPPLPTHWLEMISAAAKLSSPFEFVRVDLYDTKDGVFFGEFTLAPDASRGFIDNEFCIELLKKIKEAQKNGLLY